MNFVMYLEDICECIQVRSHTSVVCILRTLYDCVWNDSLFFISIILSWNVYV